MKIGLVGTFDVNNFGDCMFPELYAHLLKEEFADATFELYSPTSIPADILSFSRLRSLPKTLNDVAKFKEDSLILVGGETVGVGHSSGTYNFSNSTLSAYLRLWLGPVMATLNDGATPTFFAAHCVGAKKMKDSVSAQVAEVLSGASRCSFRDAFSVSWIQSGDISFERETDPMFLIDHLMAGTEWKELASKNLPNTFEPSKYVVAQISAGYGGNDITAWAKAVAEISEKTRMPILLLPICHFLGDEEVLKIASKRLDVLGVKNTIARGEVNVKVTAALIGQSAGYCGSSLHGAVTAVAFSRPIAVLGHSMDGKHEGSMRAIGVSGSVTTASAGLPACFETTSKTDLNETRSRAQKAARDCFDGLVLSLKQARGPNERNDLAVDAAYALVAAEAQTARQFGPARLKRTLLRVLHSVPLIGSGYRNMRLRQRINKSISR